MEILISKKAGKQLDDLLREAQKKIKQIFILIHKEGTSSSLDIKKLRGLENHYRIRTGNYRVLFEFDKPDTLRIYWVGIRSQAYKS